MLESIAAAVFLLGTASPLSAQVVPPPTTTPIPPGMRVLDAFDGLWRGEATVQTGPGPARQLIHTERVGSLLNGDVKLIEGRSYNADGSDCRVQRARHHLV